MAHPQSSSENSSKVHHEETKEVTTSNENDKYAYVAFPSCERKRALLGVFFDCFEELRSREIESAKRDLERCRNDRNATMQTRCCSGGSTSVASCTAYYLFKPKRKRICENLCPEIPQIYHVDSPFSLTGSNSVREARSLEQLASSVSSEHLNSQEPCDSLSPLKERILRNMDTLTQAYASTGDKAEGSTSHQVRISDDFSLPYLSDFAKVIHGATLFGQTCHLASLKYDISNAAYHSTVSSLEFSSADNTLFSVADISRTIQVFDIRNVLEEPNEFQYPIAKMECNAKISCVAWNPKTVAVMVNSGYDGSVTVWDINKVRKLRTFNEHEKRCWSVCFARTESHICATGSNDCSVKIWNLNMANSAMTLRPRFVVCTVNFGFSRHEIAVGSADRNVYLYDLRMPVCPTSVFVGHRQAVSYVRYLNSREIVSASTDNNLRLWNARSKTCTRVFHGHKNAKNFVGLNSCGDHIITGSEDNRAYVYYKGATRPILSYDMESCKSFISDVELSPSNSDNDSEVFVSAVTWRPATNIVLVGNSDGKVHVVELRQ